MAVEVSRSPANSSWVSLHSYLVTGHLTSLDLFSCSRGLLVLNGSLFPPGVSADPHFLASSVQERLWEWVPAGARGQK